MALSAQDARADAHVALGLRLGYTSRVDHVNLVELSWWLLDAYACLLVASCHSRPMELVLDPCRALVDLLVRVVRQVLGNVAANQSRTCQHVGCEPSIRLLPWWPTKATARRQIELQPL